MRYIQPLCHLSAGPSCSGRTDGFSSRTGAAPQEAAAAISAKGGQGQAQRLAVQRIGAAAGEQFCRAATGAGAEAARRTDQTGTLDTPTEILLVQGNAGDGLGPALQLREGKGGRHKVEQNGAVAQLAAEATEAAEPAADPGTVEASDPIQQAQEAILVRTQKLQLQVERLLEESRARAATEPQAALTQIKRGLGTVRGTTDIDPAIRTELIRRLSNLKRFVEVSEQHFEQKIRKFEANVAAIKRRL